MKSRTTKSWAKDHSIHWLKVSPFQSKNLLLTLSKVCTTCNYLVRTILLREWELSLAWSNQFLKYKNKTIFNRSHRPSSHSRWINMRVLSHLPAFLKRRLSLRLMIIREDRKQVLSRYSHHHLILNWECSNN